MPSDEVVGFLVSGSNQFVTICRDCVVKEKGEATIFGASELAESRGLASSRDALGSGAPAAGEVLSATPESRAPCGICHQPLG